MFKLTNSYEWGYKIITLKEHEQQEKPHKESFVERLHEFDDKVMIFRCQEGKMVYKKEEEQDSKAIGGKPYKSK